MAKVKKEEKASKPKRETSSGERPSSSGERATMFKGYNLEALPHEALPWKDTEYKGKHSYTVCIGDAAPQPKEHDFVILSCSNARPCMCEPNPNECCSCQYF